MSAVLSPREGGVSWREAGSGPGVVCLHASSSSSSQWRGLMQALAPDYHVLAPDSYGAGDSPDWPSTRAITLADEAALIEPVLRRAGERVTLVGHSYGAGIALTVALANPGRVRAMVLYEPTLFSLIDQSSPAAEEMRRAVAGICAALDSAQHELAAARFVDYWSGAGAWLQTPVHRRPAIMKTVEYVPHWASALFDHPAPLEAFGRLEIPILYLTGSRSPAPARAVARALLGVLPCVGHVDFESLGHMGPVTHADVVNEVIREFLDRGKAAL